MAESSRVERVEHAPANVISIRDLRIRCSRCDIRELCLPVGLDAHALQQLDEVVATRRRIKRGEALHRAGDPFTTLCAVRVGTFKTTVLAPDGREQITGYQMSGDVLGLDGIASGRHRCDAIALEDSEACVMPFDRLAEVARAVPALQQSLHRLLSREIGLDQQLMLTLGKLRAEERLAAFLVNLGERHRTRGFASSEFVLRMTRAEIGNYLGLELETVSRLFSRFSREGLLQVDGRIVRRLDIEGLRKRSGERC
jgi:CRP/FNR family transcriptional regulator